MSKLYGAKILLFYPFGATKHYGESIKDELIGRGAIVKGYDERPSQKSLAKIIIRLFKKRIPKIFLMYIKRIIRENEVEDFDYILVLRGEAFTKETLDLLKITYKNCTTILYLWDILKSTNLGDAIPYFDKVLSFDPEDVSNNPGLIFRPTFFMPVYENIPKNKDKIYDIMFIGTLHSNRYKVLEKISIYLQTFNFSYFFYIYVPGFIVFLKHRLIDKIPVKMSEVHFNSISVPDTLDVIGKSRCILDLNFTEQKSLSMRAFEAMAAKTKYITTNTEIKKYDFYNENNILVLDVNNIHIPREFVSSSFDEIPRTIMFNYSVEQLVNDLFS